MGVPPDVQVNRKQTRIENGGRGGMPPRRSGWHLPASEHQVVTKGPGDSRPSFECWSPSSHMNMLRVLFTTQQVWSAMPTAM